MAFCTFCNKPAEKEIKGKHVCKVCAKEIVKTFENELKDDFAKLTKHKK